MLTSIIVTGAMQKYPLASSYL